MMNTSRSRQLARSWTSRQSLANRSSCTGCCGKPRKAQISGVSSGWAAPRNTAIPRNYGSRCRGSLGFVGRQAELIPDIGLDDLRRGACIDSNDVLLAPEHVEDGGGLLVGVHEPDTPRPP